MGKSAFESIRQGLREAVGHAQEESSAVKIHRPQPVDVKALRNRVAMTQEQFAARFGFPWRHCGTGNVATAAPKVRRWLF